MKIIAAFVALGVALAAGFFLGQKTRKHPSTNESVAATKSLRIQVSTVTPTSYSPLEVFLNNRGSDRELLKALTQTLENASISELETLHKEINLSQDYENWSQVSVARSLLFQRWAEVDSAGAIQAASTIDLWNRQEAFSSIFTALTRQDSTSSWQTASSLESKALRRLAQNATIGAIAVQDLSLIHI